MSKTNGVASKKQAAKTIEQKRNYVSQADVPNYSLDEALRIPNAIIENYASGPVTPIQLAQALGLTPTSSSFKMLCGASIAYGLTNGGYNAAEIKLEPIAKRILKPLEEGDDLIAKREAFLKPKVNMQFMTKYNGNMIPRADIAYNILSTFNVPGERVESVFSAILKEAKDLGLITDIKGKYFVDLKGAAMARRNSIDDSENDNRSEDDSLQLIQPPHLISSILSESDKNNAYENKDSARKKKVYITHGKDMSFVEPIKKLLKFGEMEAMVSVEKQSVSKPVPDKVMSEMRSCGAAIIHVDAELNLFDKDAKEHVLLNPNVLIEIGAAMALFGRRFILLVKNGVALPSNLQGLYEVRYEGDKLSGDVTIKLLEAINDIKNQPLPNEI
jgi:predicted nucleotide-binding protein